MNLPGSEIRVSSWSELLETIHSQPLIQHSVREGGHRRSPYVFRGLSVAKWMTTGGMLTSLQRIPKNANAKTKVIEHSLIRSFRKYASAGAFDDKSEWYVLAVAQHNGLPTRCLDWTSAPLVAAHFACDDEAHKNEDGTIWCVHAGILRDIAGKNGPNVPSLHGIAWVYDTRLLEASYQDLAALDKSKDDGTLMLLWEPPSLDSRIASQSGLLSIMNSAEDFHHDFLNTYASQFSDLVLRIIIDAGAKSQIRDMLDQNNISERTLFPGLPGLCDWLKRYYGKAW
jgi:hypothetical protein